MIRKYIIVADDSLKGFDEEIAKLEREWGAEEIEPSEDCVSRDDLNNAISELTYWHYEDGRLVVGGDGRNNTVYKIDDVTRLVHVLPPVTPQQTRWIPVSERLPEVGEKVLCQCQANIYEVLKLTGDGWYHDKNHCYMLGFVIVWMPLPEPYKEGEENV